MRQPPEWTQFYKYPVIAGISILAIATTIAWWCKVDVSPMFETAMIRRGELWRVLTSTLPHINVLHLVFNLYWFWIFGTIVEEIFGHIRTAALIVLLAAGSGSLEFAFADGGVGLSGVGYGLFGMLWVLSLRDERFREAMDRRTVLLFVGWFLFCVITTLAKWYSVANVAHGTGALIGALVGFAISATQWRVIASAAVVVLLGLGLWGSTLGRPRINLSARGGYDEAKWGYDALQAGRNQEAARWLGDAVIYKPKLALFWYDLGIAQQRLGNMQNARADYERAQHLEPNNAKYADAATQSR